ISSNEEYYIILHVGRHFVKDPYVIYVGGEVIRFKEIDLYVEHEVENPIILGEIFLLTIEEGDVEGVEVDGEGDDERVETDGDGDLEKVESGGEGNVGEVQAYGKGVFATGIEVDEYIGMGSGGHISLGSTVGEDNITERSSGEEDGWVRWR
ncbi:hypothetical protein Golob_012073, partial [Gossypium lobatum]|nr:hypothetical protein [Gossypium lobatum]